MEILVIILLRQKYFFLASSFKNFDLRYDPLNNHLYCNIYFGKFFRNFNYFYILTLAAINDPKKLLYY